MGKRGRSGLTGALALAALLGVVGSTWSAEDEAPLRKQLLALNEVTGTEPMQGQVLALLDQPAAAKKLVELGARMARESLDKKKPSDLHRNATLILALTAERLKDVDASALFFRLYGAQSLQLLSERGLAQAYGGLIQVYYDNKKFAESEKACRELLSLEGADNEALERIKPMVMRRMILAIAKQGSTDKALGMVDRLMKVDPDNWLVLALKAQVQREADRLEEAAKTYLTVIDMIGKDKRVQKDERQDFTDEYRYILSGVYIELNQVEKATEQLKTLLAREPDNPTYNNDLGYILADHGMNLPEAEKMIRKAIEEERKLRKKLKPDLKPEEDRDNAAYLDSLGWVLFKQGKFKEARAPLAQAVKEKDGQHLEIYDHFGDVLKALGEKDEALSAWKKGIEASTTGKRDQKRKAEVEKKIKAAE